MLIRKVLPDGKILIVYSDQKGEGWDRVGGVFVRILSKF